MFEKIYTRLLRLYPSRFRKEYGDEALQLIRDRFREETGFLRRARLCWDLVTDTFVSVPKEYRNSYAVRDAAPLPANGDGTPSFMVLEEEPLGRGSILLGSVFSAAAICAFALFLSWSSGQLPFPDSHGRISAIKAVVERLNQPMTPDAGVHGADSGLQRMQPMASALSRWDGVLTDASGHPVRSAEIHLIGGHGELMSLTKEDGSFTFLEMPSVNYEVVVVLGGREVAYLKAYQPSKSSTPARLTLVSGGRLTISPPAPAQH
jgi:hypothetical protein